MAKTSGFPPFHHINFRTDPQMDVPSRYYLRVTKHTCENCGWTAQTSQLFSSTERYGSAYAYQPVPAGQSLYDMPLQTSEQEERTRFCEHCIDRAPRQALTQPEADAIIRNSNVLARKKKTPTPPKAEDFML